MVEKIWEGTINIMALDLLRATKDGKAIGAFIDVSLVVNLCEESTHQSDFGHSVGISDHQIMSGATLARSIKKYNGASYKHNFPIACIFRVSGQQKRIVTKTRAKSPRLRYRGIVPTRACYLGPHKRRGQPERRY